jgi:hypothetical protein
VSTVTDEQKSKVAELKAVITATARAPSGVPPTIRAAVLALKHELRGTGTTARTLSAALGIHVDTLCRWGREDVKGGGATVAAPRVASAKKEHEGSGGFRMVRVARPSLSAMVSAVSSPAAAPDDAVRGLSLRVAHTPSGLVVEGLDVDTLAALLRRLS